ncbi:MAG: hypothetical protein M3552_03880 [Planctomycetota bacterium]|nr:hypothetical protein [Planctomycetota bacterium]
MKDRLLTITLSVAATLGLIETRIDVPRELDVDRLIVRKELIVSDTGLPWEKGFESQQIPRGIFAKSLGDGAGGLWVRSRLIKGEIDDPFDDRFHALERDGSLRQAPGHISWNVWLDGAWRQMAIVQGEGLELSEVPREKWDGGTHPGRLRFQTFRPGHSEPLTDALIGQGMMSLGGGGYGGGGLPAPRDVLQLWGGEIHTAAIPVPAPPTVVADDASGTHDYALVAVGHRDIEQTSLRQPAPMDWQRCDGTACPEPTPTLWSATANRLPARCELKGRAKNGRRRVSS